MFADRYDIHYRRGPWRGPRGHRHHRHGRRHGRGGLMRLLATALLARAVVRQAQRWHDHAHGDDQWREHRRHGPYGGRRGGPWSRGGWGRHERDAWRGAAQSLRGEIGPLLWLLGDALRHGKLDARRTEEIRGVVADARRRITAILSNSDSGGTMV